MRLTHRITPDLLPSWLGAAGDVSTIAGGAFTASGVGSTVDLGGDTGDYTSILSAWGGGIVVSGGLYIGAAQTSGHFLVIFGGGHTDYFGNEVYAFGPLENDTPAYYRLRDPTNPPPLDVDEDGSGYPVSRHTYSSICYVTYGGRNWMFCAGQPFRAEDAGSDATCHAFDFDVASPNSNKPWITRATIGNGSCRTVGIDNANGVIWYHGPGRVGYYDIATNTNVAYGDGFKSPPGGDDWSSAVDTTRGLWLIITNGTGHAFYRTNNGINNDYYTPSTTGTAPGSGIKSVVWDADDDRFVVWAGGNTLYYLTPPGTNPYEGGNPWVWTNEVYGGATVGTPHTTGTFGRFGLVKTDNWRGYSLWYHASSSPVFFRRA